jgi:thiamine pyrophosphokinase
MRSVIIANGSPPSREDVQQWLREGDTLLCADGGARAALQFDLQPQTVIGDFDSLTDDELGALRERSTRLIRHNRHKDETDLELVLLHAVQLTPRPDEIVILGALGGRFDQTLANVMLLALPQLRGVHAVIAHADERLWLIHTGETSTVNGAVGDTVSLLPLGGDVHGITTRGLEYALSDETLRFGPARGISNVITHAPASVSVTHGTLLCVVSSPSSK